MTTPGTDDRAALLRQALRLKRAAAREPAPRLPPRPADVEARLGEWQRSLWLLHRLDPGSPAYNLASAFQVPSALDAARLERGLNGVVARHRLLRSTFRAAGGTALQIVHAHAPRAVERIAAGSGEAVATAVRECRKPFNLEAGPLLRLLLVEEPAGAQRLLVLLLHHILADEWSLAVLWRELTEGYDGRRPQAPEPPQYDDWVHWQAARQPRRHGAELDFWRRRLDPLPEDLGLPFERPLGAARQAGGRLLGRKLSPEVGAGVRRLAAAAGTTPFAVFAFAFRLLLHRYTSGNHVAFATPASRRTHPATAEMIGYFLNPVVITTPIDEARSVGLALRDFGLQLSEDLAHASVPFDILAEELSPPRRRGRHPLFQTMFAYQETPPPPELGGLRLEPVTLDLGESKLDLTLFVSQGEGSLEAAVEYRADRFDEVWMQSLLGHYETLLHHLGEDPWRRTADVSLLAREESERLRAQARGGPLEDPEQALLPRQILDQARRSPRAPAVAGGDEEWSYRELEGAARRVAAALGRRGVEPGDRVGLFLDRSPRLIAGLLGCHWAGAAYVPLDPEYPSARNADVLADAGVAVVLTRSRLLDRLPAGPYSVGPPPGEWPTIDVDRLEEDAGATPVPPPGLRAEHPAYVLYTSGSTGRPKGVVVTHANLRASTAARFQLYDTPPKRFLLLPSAAFDSSVAGTFWTLAAGGTLVLPTGDEARDPRQLARLVAERRVTGLLAIPSLYAHILDAGREGLRGLETVIVAGESCRAGLVREHFRRLPRTRLFNEYGPTEATVWATVQEIAAGDADRGPIAIGRPIPGVRVEVLDAAGRRVPAGIPGEAWISGPTLARGYWRRPDLTAERFVPHGLDAGAGERMYRTGDRLAWTAGGRSGPGRLLFLGRLDEQIKLRGFRIEPGEIEVALRGLPGVAEAAVVFRGGERLVAFVETAAETPGGLASRRGELAKRLPEFMVPGRIVELPELPRLPNGKVDRGRLRDLALEPETQMGEEPRILDDRERALVALWEGLLGRGGISPTDNFFSLGGHSLLAVEMATAIERDFGVALAPAEVFQHPTARELAGRIAQRGGPEAPAYAHLFPLQPAGHGVPFLFCVPHFFSQIAADRFRGERPVYGLRGVSLRPEGNRGRWRTMRDLGAELVDEIQRRFPDQGCLLAGYSFGATMAAEAARLLEERGTPAERLYLIAPMPVDFYRLGPMRVQIDALRQGVEELSIPQALRRFARGNHPLTRRPYQRAWRLLVIQPWRRLLCRIGRLRVHAGLPLTPAILHADVRLERFRLHAAYRPGVVRTPTVIFNAREPETDAAATWRPYFAGPFTVVDIPDPHLGEAHVEAARGTILDHLRELSDA